MVVYAGVEGGGTSWRVALAEGHPTNIVEEKSFVTKDNAKDQLKEIKDWLSERKYDSLGIGTFGPLDPRKESPTYGYITSTPKPGWKMVDVVGYLSDGSVPCKFDTDVNAPALAECMWGKKNEHESSCVYITVGTGVGVGVVVNDRAVHGLMHPEAGHLCLKRMPGDDFPGVDEVFGGPSVEGLVATPALAKRKGCSREDLPKIPDDDPMWDSVAHTLAGLCASLVLVMSPERIVLSGGVLNRQSLYPKVRKWTAILLNGYIQHPALITDEIDNYIVPSTFGQRAGIIGSLTLAHMAYEEERMTAGPPNATKVGCPEGGDGKPCTMMSGKRPSIKTIALHATVAAAVIGLGLVGLMKVAKK